MDKREIRIPISKLKNYLNEVGIIGKTLADLSGISVPHLNKALNSAIDERDGKPRELSDKNLMNLQEALHKLALKLKYIFIFYNTDLEVRKQGGRCYCPDCVDQIKSQLSPYISILPFMQYALGWNRSKVLNVMNCKSGIVYGNISQDDVDRINLTLAEVATRLDIFTLTKN